MGFSMFSAQNSPIAIDFGSSSVKILQLGTGERPALLGAAELKVPESIAIDPQAVFDFYNRELPTALNAGNFKGKKVITAIPSQFTFIQHMQVGQVDGLSRDEVVKAQLQVQTGCSPKNIVVRSVDVTEVNRDGQNKREMICMAVGKDTVMRYVDLLKRCKLEVVGMHTEVLAMVRAFDHLHRRDVDSGGTTLYIDMGWAGTRVAITHGTKVAFARYISIGGRHFDQLVAKGLKCDIASARAHRLSLDSEKASPRSGAAEPSEGMALLSAAIAQASADETKRGTKGGTVVAEERRQGVIPTELGQSVQGAEMPRIADSVDLGELLDTVTDELSMSLRYHRGLFPDRNIDRAIFLGGEARQAWLCQHVVRQLGVSAQLGDPLARFDRAGSLATPGLDLSQPQPGWAVACGLCTAPTDL